MTLLEVCDAKLMTLICPFAHNSCRPSWDTSMTQKKIIVASQSIIMRIDFSLMLASIDRYFFDMLTSIYLVIFENL